MCAYFRHGNVEENIEGVSNLHHPRNRASPSQRRRNRLQGSADSHSQDPWPTGGLEAAP